jgi:hypothetical protein
MDAIPGALDAWSAAVSGWFDETIALERRLLGDAPCQYYNQLTDPPQGAVLDQDIVWNGFSGTLRNRWGRAEAFRQADRLFPLTERIDGPGSYFVGPQWQSLLYRPQDEYCEWHLTRDPAGTITRVTFTSEPPEYWQALHGDHLPDLYGAPRYPSVGDPRLVLDLYRSLVSEQVEYEDLICAEDYVDYSDPHNPALVYPKGSYNPYNKWNTTHGIVHLTEPANSLGAEIKLGGDATVLFSPAAGDAPLADPDALISCAGYGGLNRCSDPTIGASVNELAVGGFAITLKNPVGLYMDHLDMTGWTQPDGSPVDPSWFRIVRGSEGFIEHAIFEVPADAGFAVGDLRIGGAPIVHGGQLAERMAMKITGSASQPGRFSNAPVRCRRGVCAEQANPKFLHYRDPRSTCGAGLLPAFDFAPPEAPARTAQTTPAQPADHPRQPAHRSR